MLLAEELILLLLDDRRGSWLVRRPAVRGAVRVALVVELLARRRLALDDAGVLVDGVRGGTGGDEILERAARDVVGHRPEQMPHPRRAEAAQLLGRLRGQGVLRRGRVLPGRHLPRDAHPEAGVRARLREALGIDRRPDRHTALLVALAFELDLLPTLLPEEDPLVLTARGATIVHTLRTDLHYFPTSLPQEAQARASAGEVAVDVVDVMGGIGDALEFLDVLVGAARLLSLPIRGLIRLLGELP